MLYQGRIQDFRGVGGANPLAKGANISFLSKFSEKVHEIETFQSVESATVYWNC